jgi:hypothetical protein
MVTHFFLRKKSSVFCNILSSALSRHWSCKWNRFSHLHFLAIQNRTETILHFMSSHFFEGLLVQVTVFNHARRTVSCCRRWPVKRAENNAGLCSHGYSAPRCKLQLSETEHCRAEWSRGNALDLCLRRDWFEYWPGHRLSWLKFFLIFLTPYRKNLGW